MRVIAKSALLAAALVLLPLAGIASAETWPARPVRVVVSFPAGGATDIVARLHREIVTFSATPEAKAQFAALGFELTNTPPDGTAALIETEVAKWAKVVKDANIKVE